MPRRACRGAPTFHEGIPRDSGKETIMRHLLIACACLLCLTGCGGAPGDSGGDDNVAMASSAPEQELPTVLVYKSATCGCCNGWIEHLREAGFTVDARDVPDINSVKVDAGVPRAMSSCHTALVDGYVVEGHVPAEQIRRLLAERPDVEGIAAPGMPIGSPGMEGPGATPYEVLSFSRDGSSAVFAEIEPR
jgi:hypothetical protein